MTVLEKKIEKLLTEHEEENLFPNTHNIIQVIEEWLEKHRKDYGKTKPVYYLIRQQTIDWLLADLSTNHKEPTEEKEQ